MDSREVRLFMEQDILGFCKEWQPASMGEQSNGWHAFALPGLGDLT
jgi:hypothetical protein